MAKVAFADIAFEDLHFRQSDPAEALILKLIDNKWVQRLRDISQTGSTRYVYMFSEHSRFGHTLGVVYLSKCLLGNLEAKFPQAKAYRAAVLVAALLHDIGHLAPGSHLAAKVWFPLKKDQHEQTAVRVIDEDEELSAILSAFDPGLPALVAKILSEDPSLPPWTWQLLSGSGWNTDRGNWCIVDSIMAGVSYGRYNVSAITDSLVINPAGELCLKENRLDAMLHFTISRHAMYMQVYQHRVLLTIDQMIANLVRRLRDVLATQYFADSIMTAVIASSCSSDLRLNEIYGMQECWWRYHLLQWAGSSDPVVADLADRVANRRLFKTIPAEQVDPSRLEQILRDEGFRPDYYLNKISSIDRLSDDYRNNLKVLTEDGVTRSAGAVDSLSAAIAQQVNTEVKSWYIVPDVVKASYQA